jgi:hypothetical protein
MMHRQFNLVLRIKIQGVMTTETPNGRERAVIQSKKRFPKGRFTSMLKKRKKKTVSED